MIQGPSTGDSGPAPQVQVHGDDTSDSLVGRGEVVLPDDVAAQERQRAARCPDCSWRVGDPCDTPYGMAFGACTYSRRACPEAGQLQRVWWRPAQGSWQDAGLTCSGASGTVTLSRLGSLAAATFRTALPVLHPTVQPERGVLTHVPVAFAAGQPTVVERSIVLAGHTVRVRALARWEWDFGDGSSLMTQNPGGAWPDLTVSHAYRAVGSLLVRVHTVWTGSFQVAGLGDFPIPESVEQDAQVPLAVGQGRAVLAQPPPGGRTP